MSEEMTCSSCSKPTTDYIVTCNTCEEDENEQCEEAMKPDQYAIELIDVETGKHKGDFVGIAPNFSRLDMVKDTKFAITFGTLEQAGYFMKYCKKSSGGLDCVITKI